MADESASPEDRTIEPSAARREEFRREGRVAISRDVMGAVHMAAIVAAFSVAGGTLYEAAKEVTSYVLERFADDQGVGLPLLGTIVQALAHMAGPLLTIAFIGLVAVLASGLGQTRGMFSWKLIGFKLDRINPLGRLKEQYSPSKLAVRVGLATAKITLAGLVMWAVLSGAGAQLAYLGLTSMETAWDTATGLLWSMLLGTAGVMAAIAVVDYVWQRRQLLAKMRMTREEAKREQAQQEGKPEYKQRRRQMHRELSLNRIIEAVPAADVIVTNPTHLAIALRYRPGEDEAPVVTARGADSLAAHMRYLARRHAVPIVENKRVARQLWRRVRPGKPVPANLYEDVARILAQVYKARKTTPVLPERGSR